ncbi:amidohydrolase family protein [Pseudonocardia acaciae]|uniref:amidohydrolase family protein n=1 Tax=Pseudonocardia acaciae TaxID=551276 RepID=UPI00048E2E7E|nr:amidohydrolase family protein [Pseudonocardia acaciae]
MDLLIENARVWDDRRPVDIAVSDGRIAAIGPGLGGESARRIDAAGRAVLPGFVEPHLHIDKALLYRRQPTRDGTLEEAIRLTAKLKAEQDREDVLERSRAVLDMAVRAGTVAVRVHPDVDPLQGLVGVETALLLRDEYRDLIDIQVVAFPQEGIVKAPGTLELMAEAMRMGASVVGGCPYNESGWDDTERHIAHVFDLADRFDAPVDMHADFADDCRDPRFSAARYIAEQAIKRGQRSRVSLGHVTSLASFSPEEAAPTIDLLREADIHIVTLPATDLYLGGRRDARNQRRGLTPVHLLRDSGVNVTFSSNNVRNAFTPFGKADPLLIGNLLAHAAQFGTPHSQAEVLRMATHDAARSIGIGDSYGLAVGRSADLVVFDCQRVDEVLLDLPVRRWVVKRGRVTVETRHECVINRSGAR